MPGLHSIALVVLARASPATCQDTPPTLAPPPKAQETALPLTDEGERRWTDAEDGWFDLSDFLEQPHGFLPLVIPITEPALGYGAVGSAVFLRPREEAGAEGWARPNMTMVGGLWTDGGSTGLLAGDSSFWLDGNLQTLIGGGKLDLELELHGIGEDTTLEDHPLDYSLEMTGIVAEGRQRLGDSHFWAGLRLAYGHAEVDFDGSATGIPGVGPEDDDVTIAGPTVILRYDSFDNLFTPTRGTLSETTVSVFDDAFGGSQDFQRLQQALLHHWRLSEEFFLGARAEGDFSFGDTPFYARPYISLRGVPALRYQGEHAVSGELELRWQFHPRFSLVGFGGAGYAWTDLDAFEREQGALSEGLGFRYELARKFGLHGGLDVARGPEEGAIYVVFGNAWLRP